MVGHIDSIETLGLVDGPGIRVVVFLQGCPLRCLFCHNPETWTLNDKFLITPDELVRHIYKYRNYFGTNGGVTFSGGEPLFQHDFLLECLKLCKKMGINTCLDTSGSCRGYEDILKYVDLVIWDVKALENDAYHKNVSKVELLPYHLLGVSKYKQLGIPYRLEGVPAMDKDKCDELYKVLMS